MTHAATLRATPRLGLRAPIAVIALIGLGIATYLTIVHYTGGSPVCAIAHGCETVQKSHYSKLFGIPVALLGGLTYLGLLATLVRDDESSRTVGAMLAIVGLAFSGWLTFVEVFQLHAICIWCVGSAICMTLLAILATVRMLRSPPVR